MSFRPGAGLATAASSDKAAGWVATTMPPYWLRITGLKNSAGECTCSCKLRSATWVLLLVQVVVALVTREFAHDDELGGHRNHSGGAGGVVYQSQSPALGGIEPVQNAQLRG